MVKSKKRIEKSIESYDERIKEHQEKIENYGGPNDYVVKYWEKEIEKLKREKEKDEKKLKKN